MEILIAFICIFLYAIHRFTRNPYCKSQKMLNGRTTIITGGTSGMGLEIAKDFTRRGARVIVACPFEEEGKNALKVIKEHNTDANVIFKTLDLASLQSVREFAADIEMKTERRLDILINDAGIGVPEDKLTNDNLNYTMQVNYYGHFLLTILLMPLLKQTAQDSEPSRVVNITSNVIKVSKVEVQHFNEVGYFNNMQIYGNSKICLILSSRELTRRISDSNVVINNLDPCSVGTRIFDSSFNVVIANLIYYLFYLFSKTPWEGAQTTLHVALDKDAGKVSGEFFKNCKLCKTIARAYDNDLAKQVWDSSVKLVKLTDEELKVIA